MPNSDDFCYMRRGKVIAAATLDDLKLLEPVDIRNGHKNKALLLLHGFSSSPAVYRHLIPKINYYDAIICPVLPGHAENIEAFAQVKAEEWLDTVQATCEGLLLEYNQVDVMGLSLGGLLACYLSERYPLNHLFLLAPALKLKNNIRLLLQLARIVYFLGFRELRNAAGNLMSHKNAELAYSKLPVSAIIEILTFIQEYAWAPPVCDVDLFLGTHDEVVASADVAALFSDLPNTSIHWLQESAHVLPLDNDLQQIINRVNREISI